MKIDVYKNELDTYFEFERNKYGLDETDNIVTPNTSWFLLKPAMIDEKMNKNHYDHMTYIIKSMWS